MINSVGGPPRLSFKSVNAVECITDASEYEFLSPHSNEFLICTELLHGRNLLTFEENITQIPTLLGK